MVSVDSRHNQLHIRNLRLRYSKGWSNARDHGAPRSFVVGLIFCQSLEAKREPVFLKLLPGTVPLPATPSPASSLRHATVIQMFPRPSTRPRSFRIPVFPREGRN